MSRSREHWATKKGERRKEEGREKETEGEILALQKMLVNIVSKRFPTLKELAQKRVERTKQVDALYEITSLLAVAPDEATVRLILTSQPMAH